jgi:hypothetical protein
VCARAESVHRCQDCGTVFKSGPSLGGHRTNCKARLAAAAAAAAAGTATRSWIALPFRDLDTRLSGRGVGKRATRRRERASGLFSRSPLARVDGRRSLEDSRAVAENPRRHRKTPAKRAVSPSPPPSEESVATKISTKKKKKKTATSAPPTTQPGARRKHITWEIISEYATSSDGSGRSDDTETM